MYISRNQASRSVRAKVMRQKKVHEEYFPLSRYGSWLRAEAAARAWLKELMPTLPPPAAREGRLTKRNHSGVVGVYRSGGVVRKPDGKVYESPRWVADWEGCPLRGGLSWSVKGFGEEGAFVLAVLSRRLKSVDRDLILQYLEEIFETPEFDEICRAL
jgi:hypothetical protein